jgi:hypothetical protein
MLSKEEVSHLRALLQFRQGYAHDTAHETHGHGRAVSSAVEQVLYTHLVGSSILSPRTTLSEVTNMAVEDDPAWGRYSRALDKLNAAADRYRLQPARHPAKAESWAAIRLAQSELDAAANEIEPKYRGPGG